MMHTFEESLVKIVGIISKKTKEIGAQLPIINPKSLKLDTLNPFLKNIISWFKENEEDFIRVLDSGYDCVMSINGALDRKAPIPESNDEVTRCVLLFAIYLLRLAIAPARLCEDMRTLAMIYGRGTYSSALGMAFLLQAQFISNWQEARSFFQSTKKNPETVSLGYNLLQKFEDAYNHAINTNPKKTTVILQNYLQKLNESIIAFNRETNDTAKTLTPEFQLALHLIEPSSNSLPIERDMRKKIGIIGKLLEGPFKMVYALIEQLNSIKEEKLVDGTLGEYEKRLNIPPNLRISIIRNSLMHCNPPIIMENESKIRFVDNYKGRQRVKELTLSEFENLTKEIYGIVETILFKINFLLRRLIPPNIPPKAELLAKIKDMIAKFEKLPEIRRENILEYIIQFAHTSKFDEFYARALETL